MATELRKTNQNRRGASHQGASRHKQMNTYKHTQRGTLIVVAMSLMSVVFVIMGLTVSKPVLMGIPILLVCGWLFHSLTIEVAEGEVRWRFGPGLIHKHVSLNEITSAQAVRTTF